MELGVFTFADRAEGVTSAQRMRNLLEEAELTERVGLDVFGVGEHHRADFVVSSPSTALAAIAARTERIRLTSAVSVISSDDPVRVFQQFATVDLISGGRAEIMAGRGSFIESFPLFGYDLKRYDELFAEKLEALLHIRAGGDVNGMQVHPRPVQDPLPLWIAVGGNPESAARAGLLRLPMALAIIGGEPARFRPFAEIHRRAAASAGHEPLPPMSVNSHGYVADTRERAIEESFPYVSAAMNRIGRERGWPPMTRRDYEASTGLEGANFVGSPEDVVEKILWQHEIFGHERFLLQFTIGGMPHEKILRSIELFGREVAPEVRRRLRREP